MAQRPGFLADEVGVDAPRVGMDERGLHGESPDFSVTGSM
jgi:hypothetical protein